MRVFCRHEISSNNFPRFSPLAFTQLYDWLRSARIVAYTKAKAALYDKEIKLFYIRGDDILFLHIQIRIAWICTRFEVTRRQKKLKRLTVYSFWRNTTHRCWFCQSDIGKNKFYEMKEETGNVVSVPGRSWCKKTKTTRTCHHIK